MYKTIFIGAINRSGGSLLARLFDGHPQVASYPLELGFPHDYSFYSIFESYTGIPTSIPSYNGDSKVDAFKLLNIPNKKPEVVLKWGKERSDPIGVRKNYLEKVFYGKVKTDFDFDKLINLFDEYRKDARTIAELYDARHKAYFQTWDNGKHAKGVEYILMHSSSGLYLTNIDKYFFEFKEASFICPVRDVMGYIASEKTRLARRYYGSRRFSYPPFPNFLVKTFKRYDLGAQIRAWMTALTRVVLLQERYGVDGKFIIYSNENLLNDTEKTMKALCGGIGLDFHTTLLEPTIGGQPWGGNSHQGKQKGVNKELANYYFKVLSSDEIKTIEKATAPIREYLQKNKKTPLDLTKIPKESLLDYDYQKKYFDDKEKIALYSALVNTSRRRMMVKTPGFSAIVAYLYAKVVMILHIPRMLKLKFFPGLGKQNYT